MRDTVVSTPITHFFETEKMAGDTRQFLARI
jgi:hypothetical protein